MLYILPRCILPIGSKICSVWEETRTAKGQAFQLLVGDVASYAMPHPVYWLQRPAHCVAILDQVTNKLGLSSWINTLPLALQQLKAGNYPWLLIDILTSETLSLFK